MIKRKDIKYYKKQTSSNYISIDYIKLIKQKRDENTNKTKRPDKNNKQQ